MLSRRTSLVAGSATLALLLSRQASAQQNPHSGEALQFTRSYEGFQQQRVTIGNMVGSVLEIPKYVWLAGSAPGSLLSSIGGAVGAGGRRVQSASRDYLDYRYEGAARDMGGATRQVAGDVNADSGIAKTL